MSETQKPGEEAALHDEPHAETEVAQAGGEPEDALAEAQARLESMASEHQEQLLRMQAEMENSRRRASKDIENAHKFGLEKFAKELLPIKDSLELGLAAAEGDDEKVAKLREGMALTLKMLSSCLEKFGIVEVEPTGQPFNPEQHQAMTTQESAEHAPNTVLHVMQKGYLLNERVMRPAMVVVSKAPAPAPEDTPSIDEQA